MVENNDLEKEKRDFIFSLDMEKIKKKLCDPVSKTGLGWSKEKANQVEILYKAYLFVCWKYCNEKHVPSVDIDNFWHTHILFTKKYTKECNDIFGKYFHHNPL